MNPPTPSGVTRRGVQLFTSDLFGHDIGVCFRFAPPRHPPPSRQTWNCSWTHTSTLPGSKGLIGGAQTTKNVQKYTFCKSGMSQDSRKVYFLETKTPCGVAPNIEEGLRIYPNKINSIIKKSGKGFFSQKIQNLMEIYLSKLTFYRKPKWSVRSI